MSGNKTMVWISELISENEEHKHKN